MTQHYRLPNPDISSISVDGIEHKVNPDTGLLEVDVVTPSLGHELSVRQALLVDPNATGLSLADRQEKERLLQELETLTGRPVDRRRSIQQLTRALDEATAERQRLVQELQTVTGATVDPARSLADLRTDARMAKDRANKP